MSVNELFGQRFGFERHESVRCCIRVLLMSDSLLLRAGLAQLLHSAGISVIGETTNVEEALPFLKTEPPDILLVDFDPHGDTFARIDDLVDGNEICRIIALAERHRVTDNTRLVESGAMGIVFKSDPPEVLVKAIRKVHAGEFWLDRANTALLFRRMVRSRRNRDAETHRVQALTKREREIITLVSEGLKNAAIGERLFISESTVRNHLTSIFAKLDVEDRLGLVVYAFKHGLVQYGD
jgi:two-component system nitrate/nitrite response regulator NarL